MRRRSRATSRSSNEAPRQIVIRPQEKPQFTWFDFVAFCFLGLMVFFAVQSIAGMSMRSQGAQRSPTAANRTLLSVTSVASPIYRNLVASSTPPAPAERVVVVVTATPRPTLPPTTAPTAMATIQTPVLDEAARDAARGHRCTEETPCSSEPQRASEGRP